MAKESSFNCGCYIIVLVINLIIGGVSVNYLTNQLFSKDLPWWADSLIGLVGGEIAMPGALVVWVLRLAGVDVHLT